MHAFLPGGVQNHMRRIKSISEAELIERRRIRPEPGQDLYVFGYGSLMWRPDFSYAEVEPAVLYGYHRAFCITSIEYRGTVERPGLVLGLDRGGMCLGRVFRVLPEDAPVVADYLHAREMTTGCYEPRFLRARLPGGANVTALAYVADRQHGHYAGKLSEQEIVARIREASGRMGSNRDYLLNTLAMLEDLGIQECALHRMAKQL